MLSSCACVSVTCQTYIKKAKCRIMQTTARDSPGTDVKDLGKIWTGSPPMVKIDDFWQTTRYNMKMQMSSNPSLSLNHLLGTISFSLMPHIHHCLLKCHLIFLFHGPGLTSMQHTTSHTTAVQSPSHYQWYIFIGKQWYQLPVFIPSNLNSDLHSSIRISIYTQNIT